MFEDFIEDSIAGNKDLKDQITQKISTIVASDKFFKALEENVISTVKNMDFEESLYDLLDQEEVFKPLVANLKRKLQKSFNDE